jgi:hypothetical protein
MAKAINKKKAKSAKVASVKKQIVKTLDTETTKAPLKAPGAVLLKPGIELECETCPVAAYCECVGHSPVTLETPASFMGFRVEAIEQLVCRCRVLEVLPHAARGEGWVSLVPESPRRVTIKQIISVLGVQYPYQQGDTPRLMQWGVNQANKTFIVSKELCDVNNP